LESIVYDAYSRLLNKYCSWASFYRVSVSIMFVIWFYTFFLTSNEILFDQSITKGVFIGLYLPVHFTTYKEIVAASM